MTAIPVTNPAGVQLTGLTVGQVYSLWTEAGPWHPHGLSTGDDNYSWQASDNGTTWSLGLATSYDPGGGGSDTYCPAWATRRLNLDSVHIMLTFTAAYTSVWVRVADTAFGDNTGAMDVQISAGTLPFCQYGTESKPGTTAGVIVTTALIDVLLIYLGAPAALAVIFDAFIGKTMWSGDVCSGLPPLMPQFTNDDFLGGTGVPNPASMTKFWQGLQAVAWPYFCQCTAGGVGPPPFVSPPPPTIILPPAAPVGPIAIGCNDTDICSVLNALARQLSAMSGQLAQLRSDVTLVQRQGVPFGYIPGASHGPLVGQGNFAVSGILGLSVTFTMLPPTYPPLAGDPATFHQIGKVSVGTVDGWERSWMPTHSPYLILPVSGAVTRVGWIFPSGIVATITELIREP